MNLPNTKVILITMKAQLKSSGGRSNWDDVVEKLLKNKRETGMGEQNLKRDTNVTQ